MKAVIFIGLLVTVLGQDENALRQAFQALDSNGDGTVTLSEIQTYFDRIDTNKDGFVTLQEFTASQASGTAPNQIQGTFNYYDKLDGTDDDKIARGVVAIVCDQLDADDDGGVSLAEFEKGYPQILAAVAKEIQALVG